MKNGFKMPAWKAIAGDLSLPLLLLWLVCLAIYLPQLLRHELVNWDDTVYISANPAIRGFTVEHVRTVFTSSYLANYAPLHLVSYMIDYHLWGGRSQGYLVDNLLLHAVNGTLVFLLLRNLVGSRAGAFFGTLIFLVHPLQVESVAWATERKNVLAMTFFLAALLAYLAYDRSGWQRGRGFYLLSLLMFGCALLVKSVAVILPPVLILFDLTLGADTRRRWKLLEKAPYLILAACFAIVVLITQDPQLNGGQGGMVDLFKGDRISTIYTMSTVFVVYLRLLLFPVGLSILYDPVIRTRPDAAVLSSFAVILLLAAAVACAARKDRRALFWAGIFVCGLLPVSQIVPLLALMNDRYMYFPMIGIAGGVSALYAGMERKGGGTPVLAATVLLAGCIFFAGAAANRVGVWKDSVSLWSDAALKAPDVPGVWTSLATAYKDRNDFTAARNAIGSALKIDPNNGLVLFTLARLEARAGNADLAITALEQSIRTGYLDKETVETETDFVPLRGNPRFVRLCRYFYLVRMLSKEKGGIGGGD